MTDAYYSAVAMAMGGGRARIAAIGDASVWLLSRDGITAVARPTVVDAQRETTRILSAALGIGFDAARIEASDVEVQNETRLVLALGGLARDEASLKDLPLSEPADDILDALRERITGDPAMIAVVVPEVAGAP